MTEPEGTKNRYFAPYFDMWQYRLWSFQMGGIKLERFLPKNQHTQRKLVNFEFWINVELSKIGHHFSNKVILKYVKNKNMLLNWYSSIKKRERLG